MFFMTKLPYTCKFCKKPGETEYDERIIRDVKKWTPYLCCPVCGLYHEKRLKIEERIYKACLWLISLPNNSEVMEKARKRLEAYTKDYSFTVCKHLGKPQIWDMDFVEQLMGRPALCRKICYQYRKMVYKTI